jgi:hypothetical protein
MHKIWLPFFRSIQFQDNPALQNQIDHMVAGFHLNPLYIRLLAGRCTFMFLTIYKRVELMQEMLAEALLPRLYLVRL